MLSVINLQVFREEQPLFKPLSFTLKAGEALQVRGPNGAGKSTLLKALLGQYPYLGTLKKDLDPTMYALPQGDILFPHLTVQQQLHYWAAFYTAIIPETVLVFLKNSNLYHYLDAPIQQLSAGQAKKVALLSLLFSFRPLWILDEPLTALDQETQAVFLKMIEKQRAQGGCIIAASHQTLPDYFRTISLEPVC